MKIILSLLDYLYESAIKGGDIRCSSFPSVLALLVGALPPLVLGSGPWCGKLESTFHLSLYGTNEGT